MEEEKTNNEPQVSQETIAVAPAVEQKADKKEGKTRKSKKLNKKFIAVLIVVVIIALLYSGFMKGNFDSRIDNNSKTMLGYMLNRYSMTNEEAAAIINDNFISEGQKVEVTSVSVEYMLFKIKFLYNENEFSAYMTFDKKYFFPEAYDLEEILAKKAEQAAAADGEVKGVEMATAAETTSDKPVVELFVMSHCPYGTQIEKGILPVVKALGDKIDFKLKFCDYTMHGAKEVAEQLNQYCISQQEPEKLTSYLECFLGDETSSSACMVKVGIDSNKIGSCAKAADSEYKISDNAGDSSTPAFPLFQSDVDKYQISGSPSLVVNGTVVSSSRDSASLLKTVCSGFATAPEECSLALDSATPAAGFGYGEVAGSSTDASCGS